MSIETQPVSDVDIALKEISETENDISCFTIPQNLRHELSRIRLDLGVSHFVSLSDDMIKWILLANKRSHPDQSQDAERYRWLRDNNHHFSWQPSRYNSDIVSGFSAFGTEYVGFGFEEAIDFAMKGEV